MKPGLRLQLHRSLSFWSGLLVIGFVCWAWWDSMNHASGGGYSRFHADNSHCGLLLGQSVDFTPPPDEPFYSSRMPVSPYEYVRMQMMPPLAIFRSEGQQLTPDSPDMKRMSMNTLTFLDRVEIDCRYRARGNWRIFIPHWLILAVIAVLWLALVFWRALRRSAALARQDESAA